MERLQNKVAIVTGAAQGIGEGIARAVAKAGATVVLWDISDRVHETANDIRYAGHEAASYNVDVSIMDQVNQTAREISKELGDLAVFLSSDESRYITGQEIIIDGGNIIQEVKGISTD